MISFQSKFIFCLFFILSLLACSNQTLEDFREQGEGITRDLTAELKKIRSRDDLVVYAPKLKQLFDSLADVIIAAEAYKRAHPDAEFGIHQKIEHSASDQLRIELNRILYMEGGREVIEKVQESALNRLDLFESR